MVTSAATPRAAKTMSVRIFRDMLATQELLTIYLGARLGIYESLATQGDACAREIASRVGMSVRYAREWLEQQAVAGILAVAADHADPDQRVYSLPASARVVLTESDSPLSLVSLAVLPLGAVARVLPDLLDAYRDGTGVPDDDYGLDWRDGHGGANRALFMHYLPSWIRTLVPTLHRRLAARVGGGTPPAVADVACGAGWASMGIARAYPAASVDGFDIDERSIDSARRTAAALGVDDQVAFHCVDATMLGSAGDGRAGRYDLVLLFDALHELPHPIEVLRACRRLVASGGELLVLDARVAERFGAPGDEVERFQYATSVLHCLPAGMAAPGSAASGTVMRPATVLEYARAAGFASSDELSVDDRFHRLYRLRD